MEPEQNTQAPENTFPPAAEGDSKNTLIIAGIAVIVILALFGWYMLQSINTEVSAPTVLIPETPNTTQITEQAPAATEDAAAVALSTQGTSDELPAIEADLNATDLNSLNDINKI